MKKSTRNIVKMHGWRLDRAIHNYIYFAYYHLYVSLFSWPAVFWPAGSFG